MRDIFSILITILVFFVLGSLFINLLPFFLILLVAMMVYRMFRRNKESQDTHQYYEETYYEEPMYRSGGRIKDDVIDVEYKETEEK